MTNVCLFYPPDSDKWTYGIYDLNNDLHLAMHTMCFPFLLNK